MTPSPEPKPAPSSVPEPVRERSRPRSFTLERLDDWCEKGILALVLAMLVYGVLALGAVRNSELLVVTGLEVLALFLWMVRLCIRSQYRFLWAPVSWAVIAFSGYAVWEYLHADVEYLARAELLRVVMYLLFFFLVIDNLSRQESIQWLMLTLVFLGLATSIYAVVQALTGTDYVWWFKKTKAYHGRATGTYYSPSQFAGFLELVLPIALAYVLMGRMKALPKVFIGYAAVVIVAGLGVTLSRGAWAASALGLLLFFGVLLFNRDFRLPAAVLLALLCLGGAYFGNHSLRAKERVEQVNRYQDRYFYWNAAIAMWELSPITGVGPNHFDIRFLPYRHWQAQLRPVYAHNDYLNTLADYGEIGLALVLCALTCLGVGAVKTWKYVKRSNEIVSKPSNRAAIVLGCSTALLIMAFHSFTDFNMHMPATALVVITLMAVLTSHLRYATEGYWFNPGITGRVLGALILGAGISWLSLQIWRLGRECYYQAKADKDPWLSKQRLAHLQLAYRAEPLNQNNAWDIAEWIRRNAWEAYEGQDKLLHDAIPWYEVAMPLNKWNPYPMINYGMCLDWLNEHDKAGALFNKALAMDPNGFYAIAMQGWHRLQLGDLQGALVFFKKSWSFNYWDNEIASSYIGIIERRLAEAHPELSVGPTK